MRLPNKPIILFAGGGTGGHLFPGIALAEELKNEFGWNAVFLSTAKQIENTIFAGTGFDVRTHNAPKMTKNPFAVPSFLLKLHGAMRDSAKIIDELQPAAVVGLGGYASFSPVYAAARRRIPVFILEQNSVPGKANRLLSRWADRVFAQWAGSLRYFSRCETVELCGNPVRPGIRVLDPAESRVKLGLDASLRTLLVVGGSQGARALNDALRNNIDILSKRKNEFQVLHLSGEKDAPALAEAYECSGIRGSVKPFLKEMELAYSAADLVLARAGGTTIAEISALGKPSVLVPFPFATDNHQYANAKEYADAGAAKVLEEKDISAESLQSKVMNLLFNAAELERMSLASEAAGRPQARTVIVCKIVEHITGKAVGPVINERSA